MAMYPTAMYRVTEHDGLRVYSMDETPPVIEAPVRNDAERALLKRYGYRLVEVDPSIRGGIYARGRMTWLRAWLPVVAYAVAWHVCLFLYERPLLGFKPGTRHGVEIRLRDLRPFPLGRRIGR